MLRSLKILSLIALLLSLQGFFAKEARAQDLEPRRWSHLPVGMNVFGIGGGWSDGNIAFDPVLLIEDATFDVYPFGLGYVRSFELWGKTNRVDIKVPWMSGRWRGLLDGEFTEVHRRGFSDPWVRWSINLLGAPPLKGKEYLQYRQENPVTTNVGFAVSARVPLGEYKEKWLINLGQNRWVIRPQLGVLHQRRKWQFELTGSVFLYETNDEFWKGTKLEQDALWFAQAHAIYSIKPRWWVSASAGYAYGGRAYVNDVKKSNIRTRYAALSFGLPVNANQGLKFVYLKIASNLSTGKDSDTLLVAWSINWGS